MRMREVLPMISDLDYFDAVALFVPDGWHGPFETPPVPGHYERLTALGIRVHAYERLCWWTINAHGNRLIESANQELPWRVKPH